MKKVLLFIVMLFVMACTSKSSKHFSEDKTDELVEYNDGTVIVNDEIEDGIKDKIEEEFNDVDSTTIRDCSNECGNGQETFYNGNWQGCSAPQTGDTRTCNKTNDFGTCLGKSICDIKTGWSECDAKEPEEEIYDGIDNNCDGEIDEGLINPVVDGSIDDSMEKLSGDDKDNPTGKPGITLSKSSKILPYLWAANHDHNSVSKFNMDESVEEARYWVGQNPSRTAVDLNGDMWVGGRNDARVTHITWDMERCIDRNKNNKIDTSYVDTDGTVIQINNAQNPYLDECVLYSEKINPNRSQIRGVAVTPDGFIWIGFTDGGLQYVNPETHEVGEFFTQQNVPLWKPGVDNVYIDTGTTVNAGGAYGLISDSKGILYMSSVTRKYLGAFDANEKKWIGVYEKEGACSYGIAVDGKDRIWIGGYPACSGVEMYDPEEQKMYSFIIPDVAISPKTIVDTILLPNGQSGGNGNWRTTGVAVEPATGHVWTSFYSQGYTGRLIVDEQDYAKSMWTFIGTVKKANEPTQNLPGVYNDLRGVGFDNEGYAWTLGLGSDRAFKIDPATNERAADLPEGKSFGVGTHYTYSDFTGSTVFSFTAPRGFWEHQFTRPKRCNIPVALEMEGYVPNDTTVEFRLKAFDEKGDPVSDFLPKAATGEDYFTYPNNQPTYTLDLSPYKDKLIGLTYKIEMIFTTTDRELRPIINYINLKWQYDQSSCQEE